MKIHTVGNIFSIILLMTLISINFHQPASAADNVNSSDIIMQAMNDEMARTLDKLQIESLQPPYFVEYHIFDFDIASVSGYLGSLTNSDRYQRRYLSVKTRVGDHSFDNKNFISDFRDINDISYRGLPLDNSYSAIRQQIWLECDNSYKDAVEAYARKKAFIESKSITELQADFTKAEPSTYIEEAKVFEIDMTKVNDMVRELSRLFLNYPDIDDSEVDFSALHQNRYFLNSDGSNFIKSDNIFTLNILASTQASDGQNIFNFDTYTERTLNSFPDFEKMKAQTIELIETTLKMRNAVTASEYIGPVLFTDMAACQLFKNAFADDLEGPRVMLVGEDWLKRYVPRSSLANKVKYRIMPTFMNVLDDPSITEYKGHNLVGNYPVDDEGIKPEPLNLVQNGRLQTLLMTRTPVKKVKKSNGRARRALSIAMASRPSNMIINVNESKNYDELKTMLIDYARDTGLDNALIITKLRDRNQIISTDPNTWLEDYQNDCLLSYPTEAYLIDVKNMEMKPVRGLEFANVSVRVLKDIVAASSDCNVMNYLIEGDTELPCSIVAPSVLVEELELRKIEAQPAKPPLTPSPLKER